MKKITLSLTMFFVSLVAFAQFPTPYCGPVTFTTNVEPITLVNFAGINNATSAVVGQHNGTTIIAHEDYTSIVGNVFAGSTYQITLKGNTDGNYTTWLRVYADWNQNGVFTDAGESYDIGSIVNSNGADAVQLVGSITVPGNALAGNTRMRVLKKFNVYSDACNTPNNGFGQAEDYTLAVALPACLSPTAGSATVTSSSTADLTWTSGGAANAEVVIQAAGTGLPGSADDTGINVTGNTYNATLLTGATAYEFYVRDECILGTSFSTWAGPFAFNTTMVPGCAGNVAPADGATGVVPGNVTFTWTAPTTGDPAVSYDLYYGLTPGNATIFVANYTVLTTPITITGFNTTFYWKIVPKNVGGSAIGCAEWSFTTAPPPGYCLTSPNGQWPGTTAGATFVCDGLTENIVTTNGYAGEYSVVTVTSGQTYTFKSVVNNPVANDLITISTDAGATAAAYGTSPLTWVATVSGDIRFYSHIDNNCGAAAVNRTRSVICGIPAPDAPDYANLQWPPTATIAQGGSVTVYGQVYEAGLTNPAGQAAGINAWVGYSTTNTNPNTWSNWTAATYNVDAGNNDEYMLAIGDNLAPGTYYYATRFNLNSGGYVYGGIDPVTTGNPGGFWDGTTYVSGVLTVTPPPAPANDECTGAIALTAGGVYGQYLTDGTNFGATTSSQTAPTTCFGFVGNDVWYTVVVPASGSITIETGDSSTGATGLDTVVTIYSGDCAVLTQIDCDDDSAATGAYSLKSLNGLTPGMTLYLRVYEYNNDNSGGFGISAYDASLANASFDSGNFSYYPNPVKNVLNLSYTEEISSVDVFNLLGQKVSANAIGANLGQVDMSALPNGAYLVKVTTANNQSKTIKVIKE